VKLAALKGAAVSPDAQTGQARRAARILGEAISQAFARDVARADKRRSIRRLTPGAGHAGQACGSKTFGERPI